MRLQCTVPCLKRLSGAKTLPRCNFQDKFAMVALHV